METKRKALGRGLEQLFSNERIDFDNFEQDIITNTKTTDITEINYMKLEVTHTNQEKHLMKKL